MAGFSEAAAVRWSGRRPDDHRALQGARGFADQPSSPTETVALSPPPSGGLAHDFRSVGVIPAQGPPTVQRRFEERAVQKFGATASINLLTLLNKIIKPPTSWKILGFMSGFSEVDPSLPLYVDLYRSFLDEYERGGFDEGMMAAASFQDRGVEPTRPGHRFVTMKWSEIKADVDLEKRAAEETMKKTLKSPEELQEMERQAITGLGGAASGMMG